MSKVQRPQITIAQETVDHLEALVEGAAARMPELADRLLDELSRARILPAARIPADVVGIGSRVTWRDETTGQEQTATLVWPEEADIDAGRASVLTPIGVALIGLKAGSRFQWETRGGESRNLTVLAVVPGNIPA
ncbi:MAG: nucleoside diphosphate kinase regulator [Tabrizicola sp.]|jgi:regulator of nucleoside diphosphate kinase|uniref:nucleoside diphosphate kinase regulator n=1 Tax=Tabrizicola sp. TaxID=2005166 RepID=UPI001B4F27EB|nr:nucleoside diphosphate kinase regulator [Tabrizicola sp.]MCC6518538.1 nucleoside diphosphate kinase regulator [Tabrizicola sp.]